MTKQPLTRTCSACGIEKPLSAFLHLTSQGTAYGTICATCRGKGITEKPQKRVHEDERSGTTSGMRIGVKELVEIELEKKREQKEREIRQQEDLKKREEISLEKTESKELKEKAEKSHREKFLNYQSKKNPFSAQIVVDQKKPGPFINLPVLDEKQRALEATKLAEAIRQEERKTTVDLSGGPVYDPQSSMASRDNPTFREYLIRSGDTPMGRTASQLYRNLVGQKKSESSTPSEKQEKDIQEAAREFIDKTWGPSSRKR